MTRNQSAAVKSKIVNYICNPEAWPYRYLILLLLGYIHFGIMFSIENISGLSNTLIEVMKMNAEQYELMFSLFSWSGAVVCFIGGILFERVLGIGKGLLLAIAVSIVGELVISIGAYTDRYGVMLSGRLTLGVGTELQLLAMLSYIVKWFGGRSDSSFAISLSLCAGRIAGSFALVSMQYVYEWTSSIHNTNHRLGTTLLLGVVVTLLELPVGSLIIWLDRKSVKVTSLVQQHQPTADLAPSSVTNSKEPSVVGNKCQNILRLVNFDFILVINCIGIHVSIVFAFTAIGQHYFMQKYGFPIHEASLANSLVFLGVIVLTPFLGIVVSFIGYRITWAAFGTILGIISHLLYALSNANQHYIVYMASIVYSQSYSLFIISTLTLPGEIVGKDRLPSAYGVMKSVGNINYIIITFITGVLIDYRGYAVLEMFYVVLFFTVLLLLLLLMFKNRKVNVGKKLSLSSICSCDSVKRLLKSHSQVNGSQVIQIDREMAATHSNSNNEDVDCTTKL